MVQLFDNLIVFMKTKCEEFDKKSTDKKHAEIPSMLKI